MSDINIIGSGLAGPLLAILLSKNSNNITLFEKRKDIRRNIMSAGRSINLALSHRGIKALKKANVFDEVKEGLIPMKGRMIHDINEKTNYQPYSIHSNQYINSVSRSTLNKILLNKAESIDNIKINFEHSLQEIKNDKLIFENTINHIIKDKIVFGTDGINSTVRAYIDSEVHEKSYIKPLGHSYKELTILPNKDGSFRLDKDVLHIWPRNEFMLIALPNMDGSFTCTLFLPNAGSNSFDMLNTKRKVETFFKKYFSKVFKLIDNCLNSFFINPTGKLGSVINKNLSYEKQFCLIGDSAYGIVPFYGQGMNASFEDCSLLMNYSKYYNNDWGTIIKEFSKVRLKDRESISNMAIENYVEMRDSVSKNKYLKRRKISNILYDEFPDYFIPKYNMVSFTSIPYSEVEKRSLLQDEILEELESDFSLSKAKKIILNRLSPIK